MKKLISYLAAFFLLLSVTMEGSLFLRENLKRANPGDFIVTAQGKNYSLLSIYAKTTNDLTIEEISIPSTKVPKKNFSWKSWVSQGAPGHTARVSYTIDPNTGYIKSFFAFKQGCWQEMSSQNSFLPTLLNLPFEAIPLEQRKRVGGLLTPSDRRPLWQPKMIVEGYAVEHIPFYAWKAIWPKDGSDLSGKNIEIYLPELGTGYPCYFPYWLQISGGIGNAKIRIVDSGTGLKTSPSIIYPSQNL